MIQKSLSFREVTQQKLLVHFQTILHHFICQQHQYPKKRRKNKDKHRRNVIRTSKVHVVEHINWTRRLIPSRTTGNASSCKLQCFTKFNDEKSKFIVTFNHFKSKDEQDIFLQLLIEKHTIKQLKARSEVSRNTSASFKYFLRYKVERINVCKRAFISFYG